MRAGTHIEFSQVPYTPATTYGVRMNTYYTVAWMHRQVWPDRDVNRKGHELLVQGPRLDPEHPSRAAANYMSVRRFIGFRLTPPSVAATVGYSRPRTSATTTPVAARSGTGRARTRTPPASSSPFS